LEAIQSHLGSLDLLAGRHALHDFLLGPPLARPLAHLRVLRCLFHSLLDVVEQVVEGLAAMVWLEKETALLVVILI
jgi:hypothetical protein